LTVTCLSIQNIFGKRNLSIEEVLKYVGVRVLDHIIVGHARQNYFNFARAGMV